MDNASPWFSQNGNLTRISLHSRLGAAGQRHDCFAHEFGCNGREYRVQEKSGRPENFSNH